MIRNFVTGIVVGGVVAGVGLGVLSQLAPLPQGRVQTAADQPVADKVSTNVAKPAPTDAPVASAPAIGATPAPDAVPVTKPAAQTLPLAEKTPPATPEPLAPVANPAAPVAEALPTVIEAAQPETSAPVVPKPSADLAPKLPLATAEAPAALNDPASGTPPPRVQAGPEAAPAPMSPGALAGDSGTDAAPAPADLPPPAPREAAESLLTPAPDATSPVPPSMLVLDPAPEPAPPMAEPAAQPAPEAPDLPKMLDTNQPETLAPSTGLTKSVDGVMVGRLPSIAEPAPSADPTIAAQPAPAADTRPIAQYAAEFSDDLGKPLFAVLLVDSGAADLDRATLAALPFPVSFVIDPLDPGAAAAEAIYRAAGKEVVMLASGIPAGATAGDLEQTFQANAAALPQAVAVMDIGAQGFQDNRPLAIMVVPIIKDQGRGLVTFDAGLNAADQVARREDVAAAVIFRDLDGAGEDTPLIRRYLDRAAFKAAQEGRVVVVGTTRPETIAALMEWSIEGKAAAVALAPITAVLAVK